MLDDALLTSTLYWSVGEFGDLRNSFATRDHPAAVWHCYISPGTGGCAVALFAFCDYCGADSEQYHNTFGLNEVAPSFGNVQLGTGLKSDAELQH